MAHDSSIDSAQPDSAQPNSAQPNSAQPAIWIVVPAFNEGARIRDAIRPLCQGGRYHIVVVDDGSDDDTSLVVSQLPVWLLKHPFNCGQGAALRTGIEFALSQDADYIVTFDADGQHDCDELGRLLDPLLRGVADVTLGTRFAGTKQTIPLKRRLLLKAAIIFTRLTTGLSLTDSHNGFRGLTRKAAETIRLQQPRMAHASELLDQVARHKLVYQEVPVTIRYTEETLAKGQSAWDAFRIGGQMILHRFVR